MIKYESRIHKIGKYLDMCREENMLITFGDIPDESLADYCVIIDVPENDKDIQVGNQLVIGNQEYLITAVGNVANETFTQLGHITIRFDGAKEPLLEGTIHVAGEFPGQIHTGDFIKICVG